MAPSMKPIPFTIVDAFTREPFTGNPAIVVIFDESAPATADPKMMFQAIATEFNITETAFLLPHGAGKSGSLRFLLRSFTPLQENRFPGHATLASAYILLNGLYPGPRGIHPEEVSFETSYGTWKARRLSEGRDRRGQDRIEVELPACTLVHLKAGPNMKRIEKILLTAPNMSDKKIIDVLRSDIAEKTATYKDCIVVVLDPSVDIGSLNFDATKLNTMESHELLVLTNRKTSGNSGYHIRVFCSLPAVPEDLMTSFTNCLVARYWAKELHSDNPSGTEMEVLHVSKRRAKLGVVWNKDGTTKLRGYARVIAEGKILQ